MNLTNWLFAAALVGGCAVDAPGDESSVEQAASAHVYHWNYSSVSVDANGWDPVAGRGVNVFAATKGNTAYAYFDVYEPTATGYSSFHGGGSLPGGAITIGAGNKSAQLSATTTNDWYVERCTFSFVDPFDVTCTQVTTPVQLSFAWTKNSWGSYFRTGVEQWSSAGISSRTQGTYRSATADASGSIDGTSYGPLFGSINDAKGQSVSHDLTLGAH